LQTWVIALISSADSQIIGGALRLVACASAHTGAGPGAIGGSACGCMHLEQAFRLRLRNFNQKVAIPE
jgi:hypothetical protein